MAKQRCPITSTPHLSGRGTAQCDHLQPRTWEQEAGDGQKLLNWLCLLSNYSEVFLGQSLPLPARLKLTHCASDLTQSVCTWNLTCFSSSRFPCRDKNCFTHGLIKGRLCFQSFPFSVSEMFSERICWPQLGFQKCKFLWFMPRSFWSPIQTEVCCSSLLCNPQQT